MFFGAINVWEIITRFILITALRLSPNILKSSASRTCTTGVLHQFHGCRPKKKATANYKICLKITFVIQDPFNIYFIFGIEFFILKVNIQVNQSDSGLVPFFFLQ